MGELEKRVRLFPDRTNTKYTPDSLVCHPARGSGAAGTRGGDAACSSAASRGFAPRDSP